jgi:hypothetical protein
VAERSEVQSILSKLHLHTQQHWRSRIAWESARRFWASLDQVMFAVLVGVGGGIWTALVTHQSALADAAIAAGIVLGAFLLSPLLAWAVALPFASGNATRQQLASLTDSLSRQPAATDEESSRKRRVVPPEVFALKAAMQKGKRLLDRCPRSGVSSGAVPKALKDDFNAWMDETFELLSQWPEHQAHFNSEIAYESALITPEFTQDVMKRQKFLLDIFKQLAEETGTYE